MVTVRTIGILFFALAAGCAGVQEAPPGAMAQTGPLAVDPALTGTSQDRAVTAEVSRPVPKGDAIVVLALPIEPRQPVMAGNEIPPIAIEPVAGAPAPPPSRSQSAAKAVPPPVKAPASVSSPQPAFAPPRKSESPAPAARKPEPTLDMAGLTARLRETKAIGVFTKLALKNQVDDLLKQFRAHHQGGQQGGVASLRQPYDMLVLKVLAVVQDSDPPLARTIAGSSEAIWGTLADPEKFKSVT